VRAAFGDAARSFLETVEAIQPHQWELPALGAWTVRELCAHSMRGFTTIEQYLEADSSVDRVIADAAEYYRVALADPAVHARVEERGRKAGAQLTDPLGEAQLTAQRVLAIVSSTGDDEVINTAAGQMMFIEYLATRVTEVTVHTLDLQRATGQHPYMHGEAAQLAAALMASLADPVRLLLALTGRGSLPVDFNVLG
jgi:uncharacterized protein (TIGR03083 family)